jgi:carbon-monoxide dehydrogenase medium subunit
MQPFTYARPTSLAEAVTLLEAHGPDARLLAGGTDLIIRLRDGTLRPSVVVDVKGVAELRPGITDAGDRLAIAATTVMTDIAADERIQRDFVALAEAAAVVGSVQIRNRATLGGNLCNASPAADTAPPLLVYGAELAIAGSAGGRRVPLDGFLVRSGETTLRRGELLTAIELPRPRRRVGAVHLRRTRRRGHDLASVTLSCAIDDAGLTRIAYGSVGPRPVLAIDDSGTLADPKATEAARLAILERMLAEASPSPRSMRAGPDYRLAMLRVLGLRAVRIAGERLTLAPLGARGGSDG